MHRRAGGPPAKRLLFRYHVLFSLMRCPVHQTEMLPAVHWLKINNRPFPKPIFVCSEPDCLQTYDAVTGYYQLAENEPVGNPISHILSKRL
jgi:hypothetical protein